MQTGLVHSYYHRCSKPIQRTNANHV